MDGGLHKRKVINNLSEREDEELNETEDERTILFTKHSNKTSTSYFTSKTEKYLFYFIVFLSFLTRFYKLHFPPAILFDEVHFVSMAQWYVKRSYFFDIHPPLAKLCLAGIVWLTGFHVDEPYRDIGKVYLHNGYILMRSWQALHGALLPIIAYFTVKELKGSPLAAIMAASLLIFELSFQTISRAVLLDSFLYSSIAFGFYCALRMWKEDDKNGNNFQFWKWAILTGISIGSAFSIKHTGLSVVGYVGLIHLFKTMKPIYSPDQKISDFYRGRMLLAGFYLIFAVIFIYFLSFFLHFTILTHTGIDEDSMTESFRSSLIGSTVQLPMGEQVPSMLSNIIHLNRKMLEINSASIFEHYHSSSWYEWPILYKGIVYFWEVLSDRPDYHICVYLFGNPIVYWTGLLAILFAFIYCDRKLHFFFSDYPIAKIDVDKFIPIFYCTFAYLSNMLPYVLIKRTCYLYHYHPSLYFAIILIGLFFDKITNRRVKYYLASLLMLVVLIVYFYYLPFSYALPLTEAEHDARRWFKSTLFPYW